MNIREGWVVLFILVALALGAFCGHLATATARRTDVCTQLLFVKLSPSDSTWMQSFYKCAELPK